MQLRLHGCFGQIVVSFKQNAAGGALVNLTHLSVYLRECKTAFCSWTLNQTNKQIQMILQKLFGPIVVSFKQNAATGALVNLTHLSVSIDSFRSKTDDIITTAAPFF